MAKVIWDYSSETQYETGVSSGVLYLQNDDGTYRSGVVWNGLEQVTESFSSNEIVKFYGSDISTVNKILGDDLTVQIQAYSFPKEFLRCDGYGEYLNGMFVAIQRRVNFGFCYKTTVDEDGYKIHVIYNCLAGPAQRVYSSMSDHPEIAKFTWSVITNTMEVYGNEHTPIVIIDSTKVREDYMATLQDYLFGCEGIRPTLLTPSQIIDVLNGRTPSDIPMVFEITQQPESVYGMPGDTATFSIAAEGYQITFQWQTSTDGTSNWTDLGTESTQSVEITNENGDNYYRCVVKSGSSVLVSRVVRTILPLRITTQPSSASAILGESATFTTIASGDATTYQWQSSQNGGEWSNISGATSSNLTVQATSLDPIQYRCYVVNGQYNLTSNTATFTPVDTIVTQPSDSYSLYGRRIRFSIEAQGSSLSYQWQFSSDGETWADIQDATGTSVTDTFTEEKEGSAYRCIVTNNGVVRISDVAHSWTAVRIIQQPQVVYAVPGQQVGFTVEARGNDIEYEWQLSLDGGKYWTYNISGYTSDYRSKTLYITANIQTINSSLGNINTVFQCKLTSEGVTIYSDMVYLLEGIEIVQQPVNAYGIVGDSITFSIATNSIMGGTFEWQYSSDGETWNKVDFSSGRVTNTNSASITIPVTAQNADYSYRCYVWGKTFPTINFASNVVYIRKSVEILTQPSDFSGQIGDTATFSIAAGGRDITYQWQVSANGGSSWINISGATSDTYSVVITAQNNTNSWRCAVSSGSTTIYSNSAVINLPIRITSQPANYTGLIGDNATFSLTAQGENLTYQWQYSANSGSTWSNITNATSSTYTTTITNQNSMYIYRCYLTSGQYNMTSDTAAVNIPVRITTQPADYTVSTTGHIATFNITARGNDLTYQWQSSTNDGSTWSDISGETGVSLIVTVTDANRNNKYRCIVTSGSYSVTSNTVSTIVAIRIISQPSNYSGLIGETATYTIAAEGTNLTYQWQSSSDNGVTWNNMSGKTATTMTNAVTSQNVGYIYRCVVKSGSYTLNSSSVNVVILITITSQPTDYTGVVGNTATFAVSANGTDLTYQWQYSSNNGVNWRNLSGQTGNTMQIEITDENSSYQFRCAISSGTHTLYTNVVDFNLPIKITSQPENYYGAIGGTATFTVVAEGNNLSYRWYVSSDKSTWMDLSSWSTVSGATTDTLTFTMTSDMAAYFFKCTVTSGIYTLDTNIVSKAPPITVISQPESYLVNIGENVTFTFDARGDNLAFQWQYSADNGSTWTNQNGGTTNSLTVTASNTNIDYIYRCVVTSGTLEEISAPAMMALRVADTPITVDSSFADIAASAANGYASKYLPVGSLKTDTYTLNNAEYSFNWRLVNYDSDGSMVWQMNRVVASNLVYDGGEALYYVGPEGLPSGTYYFGFDEDYTPITNWRTTKHPQFTVNKDLVAGDQIVLSGASMRQDYDMTTSYYMIYHKGVSNVWVTSGYMTDGTSGTFLGNIKINSTNGQCNAFTRVCSGYAFYNESSFRQYANSTATTATWWSPLNPWDRPRNLTGPGFLSCLRASTVSAIKPTAVTSMIPQYEDPDNEYNAVTYDRVFWPSAQQLYIDLDYTTEQEEHYNVEESWEYYRQQAEAAGLSGRFTTGNYPQLASYDITDSSTAVSYYLRTPVMSKSNYVVLIYGPSITKTVGSIFADYNYGVTPCIRFKRFSEQS